MPVLFETLMVTKWSRLQMRTAMRQLNSVIKSYFCPKGGGWSPTFMPVEAPMAAKWFHWEMRAPMRQVNQVIGSYFLLNGLRGEPNPHAI